jgi:hypothetical protein
MDQSRVVLILVRNILNTTGSYKCHTSQCSDLCSLYTLITSVAQGNTCDFSCHVIWRIADVVERLHEGARETCNEGYNQN